MKLKLVSECLLWVESDHSPMSAWHKTRRAYQASEVVQKQPIALGVFLGIFQRNKTSYFLANIMIGKTLIDLASITTAFLKNLGVCFCFQTGIHLYNIKCDKELKLL